MQRAKSLEKTLMLGKTDGKKKRGRERMRWLDGITDSMDMSLSKLWVRVKDRKSLVCYIVHGVARSRTWLSDWATTWCPQTLNTSCSKNVRLSWKTLQHITKEHKKAIKNGSQRKRCIIIKILLRWMYEQFQGNPNQTPPVLFFFFFFSNSYLWLCNKPLQNRVAQETDCWQVYSSSAPPGVSCSPEIYLNSHL